MSDLIQRLRSVGHDYDFHGNALIYEAADALEKQQAGIEWLKGELNFADMLLEECKIDWSGDVTQIKAEHVHELTALKAQAAKDAADAEKWRAYKARKDAVIAAGMARSPLRQSAFDSLPDDFEVN